MFKHERLKYHPLMLQVLLMTPSEIAKVRMQTQKNPHPSTASPQPVSKPKYRGSLHCLKVIAKEEGFGGLYKGCSALLCRDCSSSAIYFLTYSALCDWLTPAGKNKPGRYWKASGLICKNGLFCTALRETRLSANTTCETSPRSAPHVGAVCLLPGVTGPFVPSRRGCQQPRSAGCAGTARSLSSCSSSCGRGVRGTLWCMWK